MSVPCASYREAGMIATPQKVIEVWSRPGLKSCAIRCRLSRYSIKWGSVRIAAFKCLLYGSLRLA